MITPEVIAETKRMLGRQLAAYREASGMNQRQLAPIINYGRSTIANAETGYSICSRVFWERCDQALQASGAILSGYDDLQNMIRNQRLDTARLIEEQRLDRCLQHHDTHLAASGDPRPESADHAWSPHTAADTVDAMKRRTALALPALPLFAATLPPAEPWLRLAHAIEHPGQLDELTLETLEARTGELFQLEEHLPARRLAAHLDAHLNTLERLLGGVSSTLECRLLTTLGEALALAGWVAWDSGQYTSARKRYLRALTVAGEAG
ncbi:MAG: helix-turn-helix domain-containing protein, partial [Micromonosporaceae bacterium]|nr:helix-turn-helix domain-containing protein [Micromonosporaceae bacterium]